MLSSCLSVLFFDERYSEPDAAERNHVRDLERAGTRWKLVRRWGRGLRIGIGDWEGPRLVCLELHETHLQGPASLHHAAHGLLPN